MLGIKEIHIEDLREEFVRDFVFPMFRMNAALRRRLPARHLDRPAADRQAPGRDRPADRRRCHRPWRHRQGQRPGPLRADRLRARPRHQGHRAVARMGVQVAHRPHRLRREAPDPGRQGQARRGALLGRRQPPALLVRREGARGPLDRAAALRLPAHRRARGCARQGDHRSRSTSRSGDPVAVDGKAMSPARSAHRAQRARPRQRHRPGRPRREPLRRHEVARHLRDAGRHDPRTSPIAPSNCSRSTARRRISRTRSMPRYAELVYYGFWFSPEREMLQALSTRARSTSRARSG